MSDPGPILIRRQQQKKLVSLAESFPIVCLIGPRQSGKTTLAKMVFPDYAYVSLEELDHRQYAETDPRGFLEQFNHHTIIDESQRAPSLFSYIQGRADKYDKPGQYILTGSAQFPLLEKVSQSLAGRAAILKLLPLSCPELIEANLLENDYVQQLFFGFYPRLYKFNLQPTDWYPNYIQTYLEKDVRELVQIKDLLTFKRFLKLCAGRNGQLLNVAELANDCGIAQQTASAWLSVLEASFIIYLLPSFHRNFNKRVIKSPKLYFYDTGLVCSLLTIENAKQLQQHYLRGAIFESYVITEIMKYRYNLGWEPNIYFWREQNGHEVDCIIESANALTAIEIKSGKTINPDFFKNLRYWQRVTQTLSHRCFLIYGGLEKQPREIAHVLPWHKVADIFQ